MVCANCPSLCNCTSGLTIWSSPRTTVTLQSFESYTTSARKPSNTFLPMPQNAMRFKYLSNLTCITNWLRLKFATMNLKKYTMHRWKSLFCNGFLWFSPKVFCVCRLISFNLDSNPTFALGNKWFYNKLYHPQKRSLNS